MCGICGLAYADSSKPVNAEAVERMNLALAHRGPNDSGLWNGGHLALAMRRLSIIDLEGSRQPMFNEDGSVAVVFNGEIYNFDEIRNDLVARGHRFQTHGDTEVIVHAYEEYGDDALQRFNGMFAIAIYDRGRNRLVLARDRLGIKPLFYCFRNGALAFSSELGSLRQSGLVRSTINPAALDAYLTFLYIPAPDTIYEDAHKLQPGEKLVFERGRIHIDPYWRLEYNIDAAWTLDSAAERYLELARDAVRLQKVSDVPLGAFLSGGIDSSTVVAFLSEISYRPVKTFTIGFDDAHADELRYARIAAEHFGTDHTEEILKPQMVEVASELIRHFGEPFADSSAVPTWLVSKIARRDVTVALSGDGGDELFAGYTWTRMNRSVAEFRYVPSPLRTLAQAALRLAPKMPSAGKLQRFVDDSFLTARDSFRRRETCFLPKQRAALYNSEWAEHVQASAIDRFNEHADNGPRDPDNWMLYQDTVMYLPDDILTKVDRMSMAHSLEARVPLLDHRLVEFAATVPFNLKLDRGASKRLVKHAVRDLLPRELLAQRKQGFAIPIHRWMRQELREHFQQTVLSQDAKIAAYLNPKPIIALFEQHITNQENHGHHLWALLMLEHWLERI